MPWFGQNGSLPFKPAKSTPVAARNCKSGRICSAKKSTARHILKAIGRNIGKRERWCGFARSRTGFQPVFRREANHERQVGNLSYDWQAGNRRPISPRLGSKAARLGQWLIVNGRFPPEIVREIARAMIAELADVGKGRRLPRRHRPVEHLAHSHGRFDFAQCGIAGGPAAGGRIRLRRSLARSLRLSRAGAGSRRRAAQYCERYLRLRMRLVADALRPSAAGGGDSLAKLRAAATGGDSRRAAIRSRNAGDARRNDFHVPAKGARAGAANRWRNLPRCSVRRRKTAGNSSPERSLQLLEPGGWAITGSGKKFARKIGRFG